MPFGSEGREAGIGLALSGGGFRAVLFHVGTFLRLNELGLIGKLARISSVSGGSIAAGRLAVAWDRLQISADGHIGNFADEVVTPLREFCSRHVDAWSIVGGAVNPFKTAGEYVEDQYRKHLGMDRSLSSLSNSGPRFVFNSTNLATGVSFRFSKPYCGDYRIGLMRVHPFDVATAVACSSAFPPVLSPITLHTDPAAFERTDGADLYDHEALRRELDLADGGVYDNMGLETVWGRYETVLVSDAGKPFEISSDISAFAPKQILRVMDIGLNQALALRKRMLIEHLSTTPGAGAYWGIDTDIKGYPTPTALAVGDAVPSRLSAIRTRLDPFNDQEQEDLINWGYALTDAAMRSYVPTLGQRVGATYPFPRPLR